MGNCAILELMYNNIIMNHIGGLPFKRILLMTIISLGVWILFNINHYNSEFIEDTIFLTSFMIFNLSASYMKEYHAKNIYDLHHQAKEEISKTEKLLKQMMPKPVYRNLEKGITTTDHYHDVTITYADICGFTAMSKQKTPMQVVGMLSKLFTQFDELCVNHDVYKVHTIGDCYVILSFGDWEGGSRDPIKECVNMVNMAIDMIKSIKNFNLTENVENKLEMRIGMHTGNVIAGITGLNIVRYDIYGPDVEIANKMESRGSPGKINISEDTRNLLIKADPLRFEYEYNINITHTPTKRTLNSYFLQALNRQDAWSEY
jgi:class 3 adenylate cyclase